MDIRIIKGSLEYLADCEKALLSSELDERYFHEEGSARKAITEGLKQGNIFVVLQAKECIGFMWCILNGAFHSFHYLHIIALKENYRGRSVGGKMMDYLHGMVFKNSDKIFLVATDFNPDANKFYEKMGYRQVGEIPSLYRSGITEYLMMKEK